MIRKCPKINSMITTSTTSPKPGLTSNGAAGGMLVVVFTEKLDAEDKIVDAGDIATILKTSQSVWASRVPSSSRALYSLFGESQLKTITPYGASHLSVGQEPNAMSGFEMSTDRVNCTQSVIK